MRTVSNFFNSIFNFRWMLFLLLIFVTNENLRIMDQASGIRFRIAPNRPHFGKKSLRHNLPTSHHSSTFLTSLYFSFQV